MPISRIPGVGLDSGSSGVAPSNLSTGAPSWDGSGNVTCLSSISVGNATPTTSGFGITFPATQSASSNANTLDDYEEGAWTPSSFTGSTNVTGITYQSGSYTKVGRLVTLIGQVNCTVTSSNTLTYLTMAGAPFAAGISTAGSAFLNNNIRTGSAQIVSGTAYAFFSAASAPVAGAELIQFSITYTAA